MGDESMMALLKILGHAHPGLQIEVAAGVESKRADCI